MQTLRNARRLARWALAWFALTVAAAIASPMVQPQSFELVCSGAGVMKLLPKSEDGQQAQSAMMLGCPLCAAAGAPPPVARQTVEVHQELSYALQPIPAAHIALRTAAPLPARGPPSRS